MQQLSMFGYWFLSSAIIYYLLYDFYALMNDCESSEIGHPILTWKSVDKDSWSDSYLKKGDAKWMSPLLLFFFGFLLVVFLFTYMKLGLLKCDLCMAAFSLWRSTKRSVFRACDSVDGAALRLFAVSLYTITQPGVFYLRFVGSCNPSFVNHSDVRVYFFQSSSLSRQISTGLHLQVFSQWCHNDVIDTSDMITNLNILVFLFVIIIFWFWNLHVAFKDHTSCMWSIRMSMKMLDFWVQLTLYGILFNCNKMNSSSSNF